MPERDYSNGQIYTIRCRDDPALIYVGSTINTLPKRLGGHKKDSKKNPEQLIYKTIAGNWDRFYMELYELYPCGSKNELERREGEITREIGTLNYIIAGRTDKEYYLDNREQILEKQKKFRLNNAEVIKEKKRQYNQDNRESINEKQRQYNQDNKEKIAEQKRQYHQDNKEKINEKDRQRYHLKKQAQTQAN